jgi:hypothetical protein
MGWIVGVHEIQMDQIVWWQLILIVLGVCLAAAVVGSIVGYVILRAQGKTWPFSPFFFPRKYGYPVISEKPASAAKRAEAPSPFKPAIEPLAVKPKQPPSEAAQQARKEANENVLRLTQNWKAAMEAQQKVPKTEPAAERFSQSETSQLMKEIGANLKIAISAKENSPVPFKTEIYDSKRGKMNSLPEDVHERLTEAYTDMRLANTLLLLSKDSNRKNNEMASGYVKLCLKIAEQLEQVMPALKNAGV